MRKKPNTSRRRPKLKKETVRNLHQVTLTPDELAQVAGGIYKASYPCPTWA
ncbi:MAG TPA: hypothetical protein VFU21_25370 [Kofleriaceae bacterium]|nr:hypothetical protein [Kofleriaceae bacterium]